MADKIIMNYKWRSTMRLGITFIMGIFILFTVTIAQAVPTEIVVKVKGKGSKFVGTFVGGARITIKDSKTGKILAEGITKGSTGKTDLIMSTPRREGEPISDTTAAKFSATVDIEKPTHVEIKALGPLAYPDSAHSVSITQWVLPGKDITEADGILLELPGFIVDIIDIPQNIHISDTTHYAEIPVQVRVSMICGGPLIPDGMWDSNKITMRAQIRERGTIVTEVPLSYGGKPSLFAALLKIDKAGTYKVTVYAFEPRNGNSGIDSVGVIVKE
jgi:hypothetical protein